MSIVSKKSYNSCPLKKRPIYIIKEDEEIEDESTPVDLSNTNRSKPRLDKILRYSPETAIDFSKSKLSTINEEIYDIKQSTDTKYSIIAEPTEWYAKELRIDSHQSSHTYTHIKSENRSTTSEQYSPPTPREPSVSPTVITEDYIDYREYYKNPYRNINNNLVEINRTSTYQETPNFYIPADNSILSPSSSHLSYGSNHSDIVDYVEPEDLSVNKNRKKVLVPTDSSANIQKYRTELSDKTSNDLYYQCRNCNKCYSTYAGLVKHQQTHVPVNQSSKQIAITRLNGNIINGKSEDSHTKPINPPRYQCKDCGKSYSTYSGLTKHQQFHCPSAEGNQVKKSFSCKNCDKVYVSLGALKMHIRTHTLPCKCPLCGKAFSRPWLLQGHIRTHTGEKPFTCQHCHRAFADRSNLRAHLQTHSDIKKYSCTSCTKTFSRMSLLSKHLQGGCTGATSPPNYNQQYSHESIIYEENHHHSDIYIHSNDRSSYYEDLDQQTQYHQKKTSYSENVHMY